MFTLTLSPHSPYSYSTCAVIITSSVTSQWAPACCLGNGGEHPGPEPLAGCPEQELWPLRAAVSASSCAALRLNSLPHNSGFSSSGQHISQEPKTQESCSPSGAVKKCLYSYPSPLALSIPIHLPEPSPPLTSTHPLIQPPATLGSQSCLGLYLQIHLPLPRPSTKNLSISSWGSWL